MTNRTRAPAGLDRLTGLMDERELKARVAETAAGSPLSVLRIVDFEQVNAAWGRDGGDAVLRALADRLTGRGTVQARLSGAEFGLLGQGVWSPWLLARLAAPVVFNGDRLRFSVAVGTVIRIEGERGGTTVDRARAASAEAGAGRVVWWGERIVSDDARLAIDLRRALDREEIALVFQPQVDVASGALVGVEALARWDHATLGRITTARLFGAARDTDFSSPLTDHIVDRALSEAAQWSGALSAVPIGVNVSARDLAGSGFVARLVAKVHDCGMDPARLTVEITEDAAMDDPEGVARAIGELQGEGARLVLDDFGTGQSSLAWLARLPVDGMKFDRSFTAAAGAGGRATEVLGVLVALAARLDLGVVAEGVETPAEADSLLALGCARQQGFLHAEPMPGAKLATWAARRP